MAVNGANGANTPGGVATPAYLRKGIFLPYGDPKVAGKTTLLLRAFPRALVLGRRDAIEPVALGGCGFELAPWQIIETVTNLTELVHFLSVQLKTKEWLVALRGYGITALIVDDFSQMAMKSVIQWTAQATEGNKHYPYKMLDRTLDEVSIQLADLGLLCGLSAHKMDPRYDLNEKSRTYGKLVSVGAPEVPSSKQVQAVPGWTTLVAPVRTSTASLDPWWPKVLAVDPTSELWISGDRNSVCWDETPANLREILRAAPTPYDLPRLPGCEWQDETADRVADALDGGEAVFDVVSRIFDHYKGYAPAGSPGERHVQWAVQDGIARHTIRARRRLGVLASLRPATSAAAPPPVPAKA